MNYSFWHSWTITILYWIGIGVGFYFGALPWVWSVDVTKITLLIYILFQVCSLMTLYFTWKKKVPDSAANFLDYVSSHLTAIGMLGTVFGLIMIIKNGIPEPTLLLIGVGTALTTTLAGLVATIILNLQLTLLDGVVDEK